MKGSDPDGCWDWNGSKAPFGYARLSMFKGVEARGNRVSWVLANGRLPEGVIAHRCDVASCCNPLHLVDASAKENVADMVAKGRHVPFRPFGNTLSRKLTPEAVQTIRAEYVAGSRTHGQAAMGRRFGVSQSAIFMLVSGRTWAAEARPEARRQG